MYGLYGFLTNMLMSGKLKFKQGKIEMLGDPMAIVSMDAIKQLTDDAIDRGSEGINSLYYEGWVYGYTFTYRLVQALNLKKFEDRYTTVMQIAAMIGFGDFKTLDYRLGYAKYQVIDNPFPLLYKDSEVKNLKVDHFLRGMNGGGGTVCHNQLINCVELECALKTGRICTFVNANPIELKKLDQNLVKEQLDVTSLLHREMSLIYSLGHNSSSYEQSLVDAKYSLPPKKQTLKLKQ